MRTVVSFDVTMRMWLANFLRENFVNQLSSAAHTTGIADKMCVRERKYIQHVGTETKLLYLRNFALIPVAARFKVWV
jgi:hypothetical protein